MSAIESRREVAPPAVVEGAPASRIGFWARAALACGLLVASGFVRARQSERIDRALQLGMESPITLADLPMEVGPWRGEVTEFDPEIAKATGALQTVSRRYVNQATGVRVEVFLLFGKAVNIYMHTPEVCYPSAGYTLDGMLEDRRIPVGVDDIQALFRRLYYSKGDGARVAHQEVYYSWWYNGAWTPTVGALKHFERVSGMYKVQVARQILDGEKVDDRNQGPIESFLIEFLPELQRRLSRRPSPAP